MDIREFINSINSTIWHTKELAVFKDKMGTLYFTIIDSSPITGISINTYTIDSNHVLEVKLHNHREYKYLYNLYTEKQYRNLGITSHIMELINYLFRNSLNTYIYGIFEPFEFSSDRKSGIYSEEMTRIAESFYIKNGYEIITYEKYLSYREKYKMFYPGDFALGKKSLIYKEIKNKETQYALMDSIIVHKNALEDLDTINEILNPKSLKFTK